MRIPDNALISLDKLTRYLLMLRPVDDKSGFLAQAGFTQDNPQDLLMALRALTQTGNATVQKSNEYGTFYQMSGILKGLNGVELGVVTIWLATADGAFRFITLKPQKRNP